ncbi:MAG TPA: hypothetical protein GX691_04705 [Clostridia bacterium]|nr:hypothetical protein [Clostridia bacterium]
MPKNNVPNPVETKKFKRQWRVGTFSMGTMLIVFGIVLLFAQFKNYSAIEIVSTWWPSVLIILGIEILAALYFLKEEKPTIKYDFLSILMVLLIGGITLGLYALTSVGIIPAVVEAVSSQTHTVDLPEQRIVLKEDVKNIVVNSSRFDRNFGSLYIQETGTGEVVAFSQASVPAQSQEAAEDLVPESLVNTRTVGDTMFIDFKSIAAGNCFQESVNVKHTIVLPRDRNVQIDADTGSPMKLKINNLNNNWVVNSPGKVNLAVSKKADVKIEAFAWRLGGDVSWTPVNTGQNSGAKAPLVKAPDGSFRFDEYGEAKGKANVTFGEGSHELKINAEEVALSVI